MNKKQSLLSLEQVLQVIGDFPTPFVIYDEHQIEENYTKLLSAFAWNTQFRNYFALKATPNPTILQSLHSLGSGVDCSSFGELVMSEICGLRSDEIMFTSNNTEAKEFQKADALGAIINFDDITHINFYTKAVGRSPKIACCRYNPGSLKKGNAIIGEPEEAKYGMTKEQLFEAYSRLRDAGVKHFGLHTMIASNELSLDYFIETAKILFELAQELEQTVGITISFINLGGGIGIPYTPEQTPVDLNALSAGIKKIYDEIFRNRPEQIALFMECGRMITGPFGQLVTKVQHVSKKYKNYIGVDASMQCLMRPALYGAYHHITVLGKEASKATTCYDVTGSLCENNDKFAINRNLPEVQEGDYLVIHDAGAHGTAMGFNYNAKLRPAELLVEKNGNITCIRRAETLTNYFATIQDIAGFHYNEERKTTTLYF